MISAVLFDMNEVLCHYDHDARVAVLAHACGKAPSFVEAAIWRSGYEDLGDAGAMDAEAYGDDALRRRLIDAALAFVRQLPGK